MKPEISVCLIVKNEEDNITQCLSSVRDVADEIVVVDTGSCDNTIAIAQSFGAKVFLCPWEDNFSIPRNVSLEQASGEWILMIDADEHLAEETKHNIKLLSKREDALGYTFLMEMHPDWSMMRGLRLFRNIPTLRYRGIFHEELTIPRDSFDKIIPADIKIIHKPASEEEGNRKYERNISLLNKHLCLYPDDIYQMLDLARLHLYKDNLAEAEKLLDRAAILIHQNKKLYSKTKLEVNQALYYEYKLGLLWRQKRDIRDSLAVCEEAMSVIPSCPLFYYKAANLYYKYEQYEQAITYFQKCLDFGKLDTVEITIQYPKGILNDLSLAGMGYCFFRTKQYNKAAQYFESSFALKPDEKVKAMLVSSRLLSKKIGSDSKMPAIV